jgi:hypothetical protein
MQTDRVTGSSKKVFHHLQRVWSLAAGFIFLVVALMNLALFLFQPAGTSALTWLIIITALVAAAANLSLGLGLRIVTSPDGIAYHNSGMYTIDTPWSNVESITALPLRGMGTQRCLMLREPAVRGWTGLAWSLPAELRGRVIPLTANWSHLDELEQEIRRYAPQVDQPAADSGG